MSNQLTRAYVALQQAAFPVGSRVKIARPTVSYRLGWTGTWADDMNKFLGNTHIVLENDDPDGIRLDGGGGWFWPAYSLELVKIEQYVLPIPQLLTVLYSEGYQLCADGVFKSNDFSIVFHPGMFEYCGQKKPGNWMWLAGWLEEREIE